MLPNPEEPEVFAANCVWKEIEVTRVGEPNIARFDPNRWKLIEVLTQADGVKNKRHVPTDVVHRWYMSKSLI